MNDLASWLLEQIAEDERIANASAFTLPSSHLAPREEGFVFFTTSRVLAECQVKRAIIELHQHAQKRYDQERDSGYGDGSDMEWLTKLEALEPVARHLALPYADRPGYREEWRP